MISQFLSQKINNQGLLVDRAYINGQWCNSDIDKIVEVINPATDQVIATVPDLGISQVKLAIESAALAFAQWRHYLPKDRARILRRWYELILANQQDLVTILTAENGKPLADANREFNYAAPFVEWYAEEAKRIHGDIYPVDRSQHMYLGVKEPIGVVAAITPWNFPYAMVTRKAAPALAAGCTIVLKPSEETPLSALALAKLAEEAGMPAGVFNVVTGYPKAIGEELTSNSLVRKVSFTGSTAIGKLLYSQCASTVKKMSLELGGNGPLIVCEDADLDLAVTGLIAGKTRNTGQACTTINRTYLHRSIAEEFTIKLIAQYQALKLGDGFDPQINQGPLINHKAVEKVERLVSNAVANGGQILYQSSRPAVGSFYPLTIIKLPHDSLAISCEEIFGPVIALYEYEDLDQVIKQANATDYGLAAYFYTSNKQRIWQIAKQLDYGMIGINETILSNEFIPFGGVKQSGFGIEGSKYGIEEFLKIKYYCMGDL